MTNPFKFNGAALPSHRAKLRSESDRSHRVAAWSGSALWKMPHFQSAMVAGELTYVLIQACTWLDGDGLEWYVRWMIQPGWDRELARHVEEPSEAGSGHPLRTCTAEMKGCLVLKQQHQTTASYCIFSPSPTLPASLPHSLDSNHNMI